MGTQHLVVLVHGLNGSRKDFIRWSDPFSEIVDDKAFLYISKINEASLTHRGIDVCGEELSNEILELYESKKTEEKELMKLSIIGHSLGGLISLYALGVLLESDDMWRFECMNYVCITSPLAGSRRPALRFLTGIAHDITKYVCGRTGEQLLLEDDIQLLFNMSDPDNVYYKSLSQFRRRAKYANISGDLTVPFCTSSLKKRNLYKEYSQILKMSESYLHIVETPYEELEALAASNSSPRKSTLDNDEKKEIISMIIDNYNSLTWDDIAIHFGVFQSFITAHIRAIDASMIGSGKDVVRHVLYSLVL